MDKIILGGSDNSKLNSLSTLSTSVTIHAPVENTPPEENSGENSPSPEQTPVPAPAPVTDLEFSDVNEKMYTVRRVNIRQGYGTNSNIIQTLALGTEVTRTGVSKGNVDRILME